MNIATHSKKFTFRFGNKKIVFGKMSYEPEFHLYAKVLVYALYHREYPTLRVEAKLADRFQPDLNAIAFDGDMLMWAECGNVSMHKVEKLFKKYRKAHYVFVKEEKDVPVFKKHLEKVAKEISRLPLVDIIIYPPEFKDWNISEEGDVFIRKQDVTIIRWHDDQRVKYY